MLSVFHNRRWDWDFATIKEILGSGTDRQAAALRECGVPPLHAPNLARQGRRGRDDPPRLGRHLVDHALQLGLGPCRRLVAWIFDSPWEGIDSGGHGRIVMEFDDAIFQAETSRICRIDRPRWWIVGTEGGFVKYGIDPQEEALRAGDIDRASEPESHQGILRRSLGSSEVVESRIPSIRAHWDRYYANIADHLLGREPLAVTAEQAREVVRVLEAATRSSRDHAMVEGPWGD